MFITAGSQTAAAPEEARPRPAGKLRAEGRAWHCPRPGPMTLHLAWFFRAPPGRRSALGNPRRSGSVRGSHAPCRRGVGVQRRAMEAEQDPGSVCLAGEAHDVGGRAVGLAYLRHDRCPAFDGVFESSRERLRTRHHALLCVGVEIIRGATRNHRVSHRQQRARMDVASHADRTSAGMRAAVGLDNRRARRIRVIRNCRRSSASLRRGGGRELRANGCSYR
jgi:hypothetical protein